MKKIKKIKILILHFPNLNNYGTGMMGLITIQALADKYGSGNVDFYCDFNEYANIDYIKKELRGDISLFQYKNVQRQRIMSIKNPLLRKIYMLFATEAKNFDKVIVLGGDDISEYYSKTIAFHILFNKWKTSLFTKVILLGQTIGPFTTFLNRFAARVFLRRLLVISRDKESCQYLKNEFKLKAVQGADLALTDLPLQYDENIKKETLDKYSLVPGEYITIVVSGMYEQYYDDKQLYLVRHKEILENISERGVIAGKKIVLFAHTFSPYGDEAQMIEEVFSMLNEKVKSRTLLIKEKIFQTRARFILGNSYFTITGRMHAAVSTFQMGRPAICLSYSVKYKGVIGESIGRYDLVVEARDKELWTKGNIVDQVIEKADYLLANYESIISEIKNQTTSQKEVVLKSLEII